MRCLGAGGGDVQRVLPDGCPEIVLNLADPFERLTEDGLAREQEPCLVVGPMSAALLIRPRGSVDLFGIRFEPAGLHAVVGCPMRELLGLDVHLSDISAGLCVELRRALLGRGDRRSRIAAVEFALFRAVEARTGGCSWRSALAAAFCREISHRPSLTLSNAAGALDVSRRTLERAVVEEVGLSPKTFQRIARLSQVVKRIESGLVRQDWAGLAVGCGYADQPHLVREFRLLAGTTPQRYAAEQTAFMDAFAGVA